MAIRRGMGTSIRVPPGSEPGAIRAQLALLGVLEVLVGFPDDSENSERTDASGSATGEITNAALGYIHDNGAPEANIPARPFMIPGIKAAQEEVADLLGKTARAVLRGGGESKIQDGLTQVGFKAANSIKRTINEGIPPPLADSTLRARLRGGRKNGAGARKGALQELDARWDGQAPSTDYAKPLVDTGQMRNAVTYVIRKKIRR